MVARQIWGSRWSLTCAYMIDRCRSEPLHRSPTHMSFKRISVVSALLVFAFGCQALSPMSPDASAKGKKAKVARKKETPYPPEFNEAVKLAVYEKKYKDALEIFDRLDRNGFCRDKTHYYMALCYHNMNQTQVAAQHYQVVYNFSKDAQLKYLAAVGYNQVAKYAANRTYAGQGNLFARLSTGASNCSGPWAGSGGGGGGGGGG